MYFAPDFSAEFAFWTRTVLATASYWVAPTGKLVQDGKVIGICNKIEIVVEQSGKSLVVQNYLSECPYDAIVAKTQGKASVFAESLVRSINK
jgi:hypothetical protein